MEKSCQCCAWLRPLFIQGGGSKHHFYRPTKYGLCTREAPCIKLKEVDLCSSYQPKPANDA